MIQRVRDCVLDPGTLLDVPGMQWNQCCGLKRPASVFSVLSFQAKSSSFFLQVLAQLF